MKKKCTKCHKEKPLDDYYKRKIGYNSTHQSECKECLLERGRGKSKGRGSKQDDWMKILCG